VLVSRYNAHGDTYCSHIHAIFQVCHDLLDSSLEEIPSEGQSGQLKQSSHCFQSPNSRCNKIVLVRSWRHGDRHLDGKSSMRRLDGSRREPRVVVEGGNKEGCGQEDP